MRTVIFLGCLALIACKSKHTPKHHDPVTGPAMWRVQLVDLSIQALDDNDKPKAANDSSPGWIPRKPKPAEPRTASAAAAAETKRAAIN